MKNYYCHLIKFSNFLLIGVLGLLGFSCSDDENLMKEEYGTPYATYSIKGKVLEKKTLEPVVGIEVIVRYDYDYIEKNNPTISGCFADYLQEVVYTDKKGEFSSTMSLWPEKEDVTVITGNYEIEPLIPDTSLFSFKDIPLQGGEGSWHKGIIEKEVTIYLEEKRSE